MHSENKECDDSVMSTSSTLLQITEKGEYLLNLYYLKVLGFVWLGWLVVFKKYFLHTFAD